MSLSHQKDLRTGRDWRDNAGVLGTAQGGAAPMRATSVPHRHADPRPRTALLVRKDQ